MRESKFTRGSRRPLPDRKRELLIEALQNIRHYVAQTKNSRLPVVREETYVGVENALHRVLELLNQNVIHQQTISKNDVRHLVRIAIVRLKNILSYNSDVIQEIMNWLDPGLREKVETDWNKIIGHLIDQLTELRRLIQQVYANPLDSQKLLKSIDKILRSIENTSKKFLNDMSNLISAQNNMFMKQPLTMLLNTFQKNYNNYLKSILSFDFKKYIDNIVLDHVITSIQYGKSDILKTIRALTAMPVEVVQHKPISFIEIKFSSRNNNIKPTAIEATDLLYSLTPFSVLQRSDGKFIFLPEGVRGELSTFKDIKVFIPLSIRLRKLDNDIVRYSYKLRNNKKVVFEASEQIENTRNSHYFKYCALGFIPVYISPQCPLLDVGKSRCMYPRDGRKVDIVDGDCEFSRTSNLSYRRFYHLEPKIDRYIHTKDVLKMYEVIPSSISFVIYNVDVAMAINSIVFKLKNPNVNIKKEPEIKIRYRDGSRLGFVVRGTYAVAIRLNKVYLHAIIRDILQKNKIVYSWLCIKYRAHEGSGSLFERIDYAFAQFIRKEVTCNLDEEFLAFSVETFVHSLAHIVLELVSTQLGVEHLRHLGYAIEEEDNDYVIYIYELADGGYGLLMEETLRNVFGPHWPARLLLDIISIRYHVIKHLKDVRNDIELSTTNLDVLNVSSYIKEVWTERISNPLKNYGIYEPAYALRIKLWDTYQAGGLAKEEIESVLDLAPSCFDGCPQCVMLERGCEDPLNQVVNVSASLFVEVLDDIANRLKDELKKKLQDISTRRVTLESLLGIARARLDLVTYVIDKCGADLLKKTKDSNKSLKIRLLVSSNVAKDEEVRKVLTELSELDVEIRIAENLHSKVYIADGVWVVEGSANLTCKSLMENVENMSFREDPEKIALGDFEKLWETATPFNQATSQ